MIRILFFIFFGKLSQDHHQTYDKYHGNYDSSIILHAVDEYKYDIVLFDGICNFCASAVQFIIKRDPRGQFRFAALQSEAGKALLQRHSLAVSASNTVVLLSKGHVHIRSNAVLLIARQLTGPWRFLYFLFFIPPPIRDLFYRLIARSRYWVFGKKSACQLSLPGAEQRFLGR